MLLRPVLFARAALTIGLSAARRGPMVQTCFSADPRP